MRERGCNGASVDVQSMVPKQRGVIESGLVKVIERHALKAQYR